MKKLQPSTSFIRFLIAFGVSKEEYYGNFYNESEIKIINLEYLKNISLYSNQNK